MLGHLVTVSNMFIILQYTSYCLLSYQQALADEGVSDHERMTLLQFVISQYDRSTEDSSTFTVIGIRR